MLNRSIHPRNWPDFKVKNKKNTCTPSKKGGGKILRKTRQKLDIRRLSHDTLLKSLSNTIPATAFKRPGSMNPRRCR